jgi:hypothetical protein
LDIAIATRQAWGTGNRRDLALSSGEVAADSLLLSESGEEEGVVDADERLLREAIAARGIRYRWGGASRGGFDCSGFTMYLFARHRGIALPHSARAQSRFGQKVAREALKPGDLLFFRTSRRGISHVGLYLGEGKFVHAANTRRRVAVNSLSEAYYRNRFVTARRLPPPIAKASPPPIAKAPPPPIAMPLSREVAVPSTPNPAPPEVGPVMAEGDS